LAELVLRADFAGLLAMPVDATVAARIERAPTIGRPLGAPEWIATLKPGSAVFWLPGEPGPKPRAEQDTARQAHLPNRFQPTISRFSE
jgi:hypothetical protein